jgi:hypothetical protein
MELLITLASIAVACGLILAASLMLIRRVVSKRKLAAKDAKSWIRRVLDALWGIG